MTGWSIIATRRVARYAPHHVREKDHHGEADENYKVGGTCAEMICKKPKRRWNHCASHDRHHHDCCSDLTLFACGGETESEDRRVHDGHEEADSHQACNREIACGNDGSAGCAARQYAVDD